MSNINQNTEDMIQMFLKYGIKSALSVEEFLSLRKQVVDENLQGLKIDDTQRTIEKSNDYDAKEIRQISDIEKVEKDIKNDAPTIQELKPIQKIKPPKQSIQKETIVVLDDTKNNQNQDEEELIENNDDSFNEQSFLAMMKSIED